MFKYIALLWSESGSREPIDAAHTLAHRLQSNAAWKPALLRPGLNVFCRDVRQGSSEIHLLQDAAGVILGTVFEQCEAAATSALPKKIFSADASRKAVESGCQSLIDTCWGRYVAFAHDSQKQCSYVLRDPTGGLPCFQLELGGLNVLFSSVQDVVELGLAHPEVDMDFIAERVAKLLVNSRQTALKGIRTLLAGERLELQSGRTKRHFAWNALEVAQHDVIEDRDLAARELRRITKVCVHSWAACYPALIHKLSGGLDSSIVLGCLQDAPAHPAITCLNYHDAGTASDERGFARLSAARAAVPLLERERTTAVQLDRMLDMTLSEAPTFYLGALQNGRAEAALAAEIGARAYFSGNGGDQLFYQAQGSLSAADYLHMHGVNRRFIEVSLDAALVEHRSIWYVMRNAYRQRRSPLAASSGTMTQRALLGPAALKPAHEPQRFDHPLFLASGHFPPGKFLQAAGLCMPPEFYDPLGQPDDPEPVQPLMSQPLLELCLRIPTYVLTHSGWDRAAARQAFRADVPREILRRRTKGRLEDNVLQILGRNLPTARSMLLDGEMVRAGLLDRRAVEEVLSGRPTRTPATMGEIFDHLGIEAWLRKWAALTRPTTTW